MSDAAPATGAKDTSWLVVNVVLIVVAALLVTTSVLLLVRRPGGATDDRAATASRQYAEITRAARKETLAFLTVDYRKMDELIAKVLAGATGTFKTQYGGARQSLVTSVTKVRAVSSGTVLKIGIGDLQNNSSEVFVAANSQVTNKNSKGKPLPTRYYRLRLTMARVGGRWLTSDLQFVG